MILQKWEGDNTDRTLIGLAQLLHEIKDSGLDDVRDVLTYYRQYEDPVSAFRLYFEGLLFNMYYVHHI